MFNIFTKIKTHHKYQHFLQWGKLVSITSLSQLLVQGVGFVSGILIIRLLPVEEYAFYTLANAMLGTMTVLADGGISAGVMTEGGKVWQDKKKLGAVLSTGLYLRHKFAIYSLLVCLPVLYYLLTANGANIITTLLITAAMIPAFYASLSDSLLQIVPKLHQNILPLQKNQMAVGISRLFLTTLTIFIFPLAYIMILANGLSRILGNIKLRKIAYNLADKNPSVINFVVKKDILVIVSKTMPGNIYYALSGQVTIWLISIFGSTENIAEIGALSRLTMLLVVINILISTLIIPRFSRLDSTNKEIVKLFTKLIVILLIICVFVIITLSFFTPFLLQILGSEYSHLNYEFNLLIISTCASFLSSTIYGLLANRGIILNPYLFYSVVLISQVTCLIIFDISLISGVIYFGIFPAIVGFIFRIIHFYYTMNKSSKQLKQLKQL